MPKSLFADTPTVELPPYLLDSALPSAIFLILGPVIPFIPSLLLSQPIMTRLKFKIKTQLNVMQYMMLLTTLLSTIGDIAAIQWVVRPYQQVFHNYCTVHYPANPCDSMDDLLFYSEWLPAAATLLFALSKPLYEKCYPLQPLELPSTERNRAPTEALNAALIKTNSKIKTRATDYLVCIRTLSLLYPGSYMFQSEPIRKQFHLNDTMSFLFLAPFLATLAFANIFYSIVGTDRFIRLHATVEAYDDLRRQGHESAFNLAEEAQTGQNTPASGYQRFKQWCSWPPSSHRELVNLHQTESAAVETPLLI